MSKDVEGAKPVQNPAVEAEDQNQLVEASLQQFIDSATLPEPEAVAVAPAEIISDAPIAPAAIEPSAETLTVATVAMQQPSEARISAIQPVHVVSGPVPATVVRNSNPMVMIGGLLVAFLLGAGTVYYIVRSLVMDQRALAGAPAVQTHARPEAALPAPTLPAAAEVATATPGASAAPAALAAEPGASGAVPTPTVPGSAPGAPGTPPAVPAPTTGAAPKPPAIVAPNETAPAIPPAKAEAPSKPIAAPVAPADAPASAAGSSKPGASGRHHASSASKASGAPAKAGAAASKPSAEKPATKKAEPTPKSTGEKPDWVDPFAQ